MGVPVGGIPSCWFWACSSAFVLGGFLLHAAIQRNEGRHQRCKVFLLACFILAVRMACLFRVGHRCFLCDSRVSPSQLGSLVMIPIVLVCLRVKNIINMQFRHVFALMYIALVGLFRWIQCGVCVISAACVFAPDSVRCVLLWCGCAVLDQV
jgi:hypothetical protein